MRFKQFAFVLLLAVSFSFVIVLPAYAYLDPGSGSYACQLLLGGLVGTIFLLKLYWHRIRSLLSSFFSKI